MCDAEVLVLDTLRPSGWKLIAPRPCVRPAESFPTLFSSLPQFWLDFGHISCRPMIFRVSIDVKLVQWQRCERKLHVFCQRICKSYYGRTRSLHLPPPLVTHNNS